ncbi:hypothetical protein V9T40_007001 [Parthenolecanium corni]|uniref:Uncharacterized protein n=1 Tax=Parthenolecanium corni TaxID=536013 RepID=A0AAN9TVP6_9HEMI
MRFLPPISFCHLLVAGDVTARSCAPIHIGPPNGTSLALQFRLVAKAAGICEPDEFRCANGTCINRNMLCNGMQDCYGGDDEGPDLCKEIKYNIGTADGDVIIPRYNILSFLDDVTDDDVTQLKSG